MEFSNYNQTEYLLEVVHYEHCFLKYLHKCVDYSLLLLSFYLF